MAFRLTGHIRGRVVRTTDNRRVGWVEWDNGNLTADSDTTLSVAITAFEDAPEVVGPVPHEAVGPVAQRTQSIAAYIILRGIFGRAKVVETGDIPNLAIRARDVP